MKRHIDQPTGWSGAFAAAWETREDMNNFIRPPVFYPSTVVFVDDNDSYLDALRRFFPGTYTNLFFTRAASGPQLYPPARAREFARIRSGVGVSERAGCRALRRDLG
ncbi:hypothetical protein OKW50_005282 [Paraburkholderia youngii]